MFIQIPNHSSISNFNMKQFLRKILIFTLILFILATAFDILLTSKAFRKRSSPLATWNDIFQKNIDADLLIMGSSRAYVQFNPAVFDTILHTNSYNLGINGRSADSQILKYKVFRHQGNKKPKLILYEVSHTTMQVSNGYEQFQFLPYLHNLYLWKLCSKQEGFSFADCVLPSWRFLGQQEFVKELLFASENGAYDTPLYKGFRGNNKKWDGSGLRQQETISYGKDTAIICQFRDFLAECRRDSIQVVLVTSPFYIEGTQKMKDPSGMHNMFADLAADFDIPFLDYTYYELSYDTTYFYNTMHLNTIGANLFSKKLAQDLDSLGYARVLSQE